ncbi:MAG: HlyD family secretion protein [Halieaceae bacterium]|jgi:membrane fusion protein, multidrug efflux system|nr:HlyD family secretion protein [Halieaceae bacterium]
MAQQDEQPPPTPRYALLKQIVLWCTAIALSIVGAFWVQQRAAHVYSDDARIAAHMIEVSAKIAGQVIAFPVREGDSLNTSDVIAQIDDREARLVLDELNAQLMGRQSVYEKVEAQVERVDLQTGGHMQAKLSQLLAVQAELASAKADLEFRQAEWERSESLLKRKIISRQSWENTRNARQRAEQQFQRVEAGVASAEAAVVEAEADQTELAVLAKELRAQIFDKQRIAAQITRQEIVIENLRIRAPSAGIVDQVYADLGEYVVPGQRLILMHNPAKVWIKANIKETEVRHLRKGNRVGISVDAYPDMDFYGQVTRIGNTATSQFSLLPSANPSGNFTKVTQRIPIEISIEQSGNLLRPGMMVEVAIEID